MMKRLLLLLIMVVTSVIGVMAKGDKLPEYDITGAGSGSEGTLLVKVYVYAKKVTDSDLKRAAVHGVVFRGCSGNQSGARQPAMAPATAEADNAAFFENFFASDGQIQKAQAVSEL